MKISYGAMNGLHGNNASALKSEFEKLLANMFPAIERFHVVHPHGNSFDVSTLEKTEDIMNIIIWANLYNNGRQAFTIGGSSTTLFGQSVVRDTMRDTSAAIFPDKVALFDTEDKEVASWIPSYRMLFIGYDALHLATGNSPDSPAWERDFEILEKVFKLVTDKCEFKRLTPDEQRARQANVLEKLAISIAESRFEAVKKAVDDGREQSEKLRADLTRTMRKLFNDELLLASQESALAEIKAKVIKEINGIGKIAHVKDYSIQGDDFTIVTDDLYYEVDGRRFLAGDFTITANLKTAKVTFINNNDKNKRVSVWGAKCHHPHVNLHGEACLGNTSAMIADCVSQYEFAGLTSILIGFLQSVNIEDSAGKNYANWDEIKDDGTVVTRRTWHCHDCEATRTSNELPDGWVHCHICGEVVCADCIHTLIDGETVCDNCYEESEEIATCERCDCKAMGDQLEKVDGSYYCHECAEYQRNQKRIAEEAAKAEAAKKSRPKRAAVASAEAVATADVIPCELCGAVVPTTQLLTCEHCGKQGCSTCIQIGALPNGNAGYACQEHRR